MKNSSIEKEGEENFTPKCSNTYLSAPSENPSVALEHYVYGIQKEKGVRTHRGLCDRDCPKCGRRNTVRWKSNVLIHKGEKVIEFGYFFCQACGWRSEFYETEIRLMK